MALCRYRYRSLQHSWGWVAGGRIVPLKDEDVEICLSEPPDAGLLALAECASGPDVDFGEVEGTASLRPPVSPYQEIWAAGVTYESSKFARIAESEDGGDFYAKVYVADRPELFFKATPSRCVGHKSEVRIRRDSQWNVPEPELAVLIAATGQILGYTVGNDMSSRDIEGANPLYLPQAKVYHGCCALGPVIVPAESVNVKNLPIRLTITRGGEVAFHGETSTARMRRTVEELAEWLFRENEFPQGVMMLTGTGIIPPDDFTLLPGDEVAIGIEGIGTLRNNVVQSG